MINVVNPEYTTAIETGVGGKFYGIGVENDNVSKVLLTKRCFDYFVQFFPLNTISTKQIPDDMIKRAENIAKKYNAKIFKPWDDTITRPTHPKFSPIHLFCTSTFLICNSIDAAAEMIKTRQVQCQIVTTDGDVFDPSGEAQGGYRGERDSIPKKWYLYQQLVQERRQEQENNDAGNRLALHEKLKTVEAQLTDLKIKKENIVRKLERLDRVRDKIQGFKAKLTFDSSSKFAAQLPVLEERERLEREELDRLKKELESAENMLSQIKKGSDVKLMMQNNLKKLAEEEEKLVKEKDIAQQKLAENESIVTIEQKEIEETIKKIKEYEANIEQITAHIEERTKYLESEQLKVEEKQRELEEKKQKQKEKEERDEEFNQQKNDLVNKEKAATEQIEQLNKQISGLKQDIINAKDRLRDEPELIDRPFQQEEELDKIEIKKFERDLTGIRERFYQLEKQINKDVESQRNRMEEQMQDLANKETILKQDKDQIYNNLEMLDEKSQESVLQCFEFVNK